VHDVKETLDVLKVIDAIGRGAETSGRAS